jgi:sphinganine-1-phosphate aldolase
MNESEKNINIPDEGINPGILLQRVKSLQEDDIAWKAGRVWSLVYFADEEHDHLLKAASNELFSTNYLNPFAFKSLQQMEQEVVRMTINMLHGNNDAVGVMTSGGTESILLAMFSYRQRAEKKRPGIRHPEVIAPVTIHPAFDKAAQLFGLHLRKAPVDENRCAIPVAMEKLINENTILIVASAPSYPNGVMDPIEAIAGIAQKNQLPFHVDACIGGFMLPWVEQLGYPVAKWDFRADGVTSVSADVHKFGFGPKGSSVLAFRNMNYMRNQFIVTTDFPGGIYISSTLLGTRSGGTIAAAWAGLQHLGKNGYRAIAQNLMEGTARLRNGIEAIPELVIVGKPCMNIISFTTRNNKPDIFVVADQLEDKGWLLDRQQFPDCIHLTILPTNVTVIDEYLADLKEAVTYASEHPEATAKGNAAIYGLMARIPFRGIVEKNVMKIMENMYSGNKNPDIDADENTEHAIAQNPAWMGKLNRFLSALKRWKRFIPFKDSGKK